MSLNIVPEAVFPPARCAASQSTTGPFVDCAVALPRYGRVYLSVPYLHSIAADVGLVPAPELADALTLLDAAYKESTVLSARVAELEAQQPSAVAAQKAIDALEACAKAALKRVKAPARTAVKAPALP